MRPTTSSTCPTARRSSGPTIASRARRTPAFHPDLETGRARAVDPQGHEPRHRQLLRLLRERPRDAHRARRPAAQPRRGPTSPSRASPPISASATPRRTPRGWATRSRVREDLCRAIDLDGSLAAARAGHARRGRHARLTAPRGRSDGFPSSQVVFAASGVAREAQSCRRLDQKATTRTGAAA